ncbi:MAG: hypothetical protein P8Y69_06125 [Gammaproteobacteria bacterium]|jgi:hypothetical protein
MCTYERLRAENEAFAGTAGVSQNNSQARFVPAFRDTDSGRVEIARLANGEPAPMHLLCGLPDDWVTGRDENGRIVAILDTVIAGFVRDGVFYTREEAARLA